MDFFGVRKDLVDSAHELNPVGYKILLELIVKSGSQQVIELPIHFADRKHGKSKLSLKQQILYLKHLRRLYLYKYAERSHFLQFLVVGALGVGVNLVILTLLLMLGFSTWVAIGGGIGTSICSNFILNRRFTFSYARHKEMLTQFFGFISACSIGAIINFGLTMVCIQTIPFFSNYPQGAALIGIGAGTLFNYTSNRYLVFKKS